MSRNTCLLNNTGAGGPLIEFYHPPMFLSPPVHFARWAGMHHFSVVQIFTFFALFVLYILYY